MKRPTLLIPLLLSVAGCPEGAVPGGTSGEPLGRARTELSLNNGPGLSANGPGLSANGPGLSANGTGLGNLYGNFAEKQAAVGLAFVRFTGAETVGGAPLRSLNLVKGELRGTRQDGARLHGADFAGVVLRGRGLTSEGVPSGERKVRVEGAVPAEPGAPLQDGDFYHYAVRVEDPATGAFVDPCEGGYAIALPGRWDNRRGVPGGGSYDPTDVAFTFACQNASIQKCAESAHYKPWREIVGPLPESCDPDAPATCARWRKSGAEALQACVRLVRGDFCGDGTPLTLDGTPIDGNDNFPDDGIEPDAPDHPEWPVEAGWGPAGATCIDQTRVTDAISGYLLDHCHERLAGNCSMHDLVLGPFESRSGPVLLNRSQRKMSLYVPADPEPYAHYGSSVATYVDAPRAQQLVAIGSPGVSDARAFVHLFRVSTSTDPPTVGAREFVGALDAPPGVTPSDLIYQTLAFRPGAAGPDLLVSAPALPNSAAGGTVWLYPFAGWSDVRPTFGVPVGVAGPVAKGAMFGAALSAAPDGRVFIGAPYEPCPGGADANQLAGAVFVLEPGGALERLPHPTCPSGYGRFGASLLALADGGVLVGANSEGHPRPDCSVGATSGALRRYRRQPDGSYVVDWAVFEPECPASSDETYQAFSSPVSLVGNTLLVGGSVATVGGQVGAGKVYVYDYAADAAPTLRGALASPHGASAGDVFGFSLVGYQAAGNNRLAVAHRGGNVGVFFFREEGGEFVLDGHVRDPFGGPGYLGSTLAVEPPFLYIGSPVATDGGPQAGYLFHFNYDAQQPTPLP